MSRHGKRYFNALKKAPKKPVSLEEAVKFVKDNAGAAECRTDRRRGVRGAGRNLELHYSSDLLGHFLPSFFFRAAPPGDPSR